MGNLKERYEKVIVPKLNQEFGVSSPLAVSRVLAVVVNMGIGKELSASGSKDVIDRASQDLAAITGQKPQVRTARRAISGFGIRRGSIVGLRVTLRGKRKYDFLEKLFNIVLPRMRDFRGLPIRSFDGRGNYTLGIKENTVFPEIDLGKVDKVRGLEVTIVTNAGDDAKAKRLLEELGMPFEKGVEKVAQVEKVEKGNSAGANLP